MKDILTTAKAAEYLGVSIRTTQLWVESGRLASWKTPGGHRRIPRQAVLDLIDESPRPSTVLAARAVVWAARGRAAEWKTTGLPGTGLLLHAVEEAADVKLLLDEATPTVLVIEAAEDDDCGRLRSELSRDSRYAQTILVTIRDRLAKPSVSRDGRRITLQRSPDVRSLSEALVTALGQRRGVSHPSSAYPTPLNEPARLAAVHRSGLVGSQPDPRFDRLVRLAAMALHAPIAMFTLITEDQQWFKSRVGFDGQSTARDWAFCNETLVANTLTIIEDMTTSPALAANPTLQEPYGFRFYAGAPVRDPLGFALGSVCVIDVVPRSLKPGERDALTTIADALSNLIRLQPLEAGQTRQRDKAVADSR